MELNEYLNDPNSAYIKIERYINDGSPSKNSNTTSYETAPKSDTRGFQLPLIKFKKAFVENFGQEIISLEKDAIYVHPDMIDSDYFRGQEYEILSNVFVEPTSSGRTVITRNSNTVHFIKLAYPKCLGRLTRHMGKDKIQSACEVTNRLVNAIDAGKMNSRFAMFKENQGRVVELETENSIYEWGMIIREAKPYPYINDTEYYMPFFGLFSNEYVPGTEQINCNHVPFIKQLFDCQEKDVNAFLTEDIIFPLYDCYFDALLKAGIELEAHGQNMLISFDDSYHIRRIIARDLESAGRDITLMKRLGINDDSDVKYKRNELSPKLPDEKYAKWYSIHSFMFDFKLGEYIVTPLLECACACINGVDRERIITLIKQHNKKYIDQLPDFFPEEWCYYSDENFEITGNRKEYIWKKAPKYRYVNGLSEGL